MIVVLPLTLMCGFTMVEYLGVWSFYGCREKYIVDHIKNNTKFLKKKDHPLKIALNLLILRKLE